LGPIEQDKAVHALDKAGDIDPARGYKRMLLKMG